MADEHARKVHNDHNVYILGAGFSADAGMPLVKDFMNRMRDAAAWLERQDGREKEVTAIARVLHFKQEAAAKAHPILGDVENVEELFSLASASGGEVLARDMTLALAATLDYGANKAPNKECIVEYTGSDGVPPNWQRLLLDRQYSAPSYDFYVGVMASYFNKDGPEQRDTIITFNYDTVVEEAMTNLGIAFDYGVYGRRATVSVSDGRTAHNSCLLELGGLDLLKFHGSINWLPMTPDPSRMIASVLEKQKSTGGRAWAKPRLEAKSLVCGGC